jgi:catalase
MFWDFHNNNQEGVHELMHLFSDRGTPASVRNIDAFSGHTYKFTKPVRLPISPPLPSTST